VIVPVRFSRNFILPCLPVVKPHSTIEDDGYLRRGRRLADVRVDLLTSQSATVHHADKILTLKLHCLPSTFLYSKVCSSI
jgi:hypothetical protein